MKSLFSKKIRNTILLGTLSAIGAGLLFAETTHVVQKGETLYSISKKYNSTIQSISDANNINGTDIKVGQKLVIPGSGATETTKNSVSGAQPSKDSVQPAKTASTAASSAYTVQKGDTWYAIARNNSCSVKDLYALNNADANTGLKTGQKIKIPAKTASATNPAVASSKTAGTTVTAPVVDTHNYSTKKGDSNLVWPVDKPEVTYVKGKVSGVSLSAKKDETVSAIKSGTVMFSGTYRGFGNVVFVQSKTGHIYAYTGLGKVSVSKGEYIDYKSQIGTAGIDSYSSKSQISLMVFQNGIPIDPAKAPRG